MLLLAILVFLFQLIICVFRWRAALAAIEAFLSFVDALKIFYIGVFFNQTLPSSVGGDGVRMYMAHRAGLKLGAAINGVMLERAAVVAALVLVVLMPFYAAPETPFATVPPADVAEIFLAARERIAERPVQLGCARPAGRHKVLTDAYAVMAGLDGIAFPAEGAVAVANAIGRPVDQEHACCSMVLDAVA